VLRRSYSGAVIIDQDGPWTAAAYSADDPSFVGIQHGVADESGSLCGLAEADIVVVRNAFYGDSIRDCAACAVRLTELAALQTD